MDWFTIAFSIFYVIGAGMAFVGGIVHLKRKRMLGYDMADDMFMMAMTAAAAAVWPAVGFVIVATLLAKPKSKKTSWN